MQRILVALFMICCLVLPFVGCSKGITMPTETLVDRGAIDDPIIAGGPKKGMRKSQAHSAATQPGDDQKQPKKSD